MRYEKRSRVHKVRSAMPGMVDMVGSSKELTFKIFVLMLYVGIISVVGPVCAEGTLINK